MNLLAMALGMSLLWKITTGEEICPPGNRQEIRPTPDTLTVYQIMQRQNG
jgi:hypothetical protein